MTKDTKEIRCLNKNGKVRYINERLARDHQYMSQMELTIEDPSEENYFEAFKKQAKVETESDSIIEDIESDPFEEEKEEQDASISDVRDKTKRKK